jgi:phage replication-related protein YjqB (UPF0714/DUF867 family)
MVSKSLIVVAIHACTGHERFVYLWGLDKMLKVAVADELGSRGIIAPNGHGRFRRLNPNNICNRGANKQGVQQIFNLQSSIPADPGYYFDLLLSSA